LKDYAEYNTNLNGLPPLRWERAYRASCFLNLGVQYEHSKHLTIYVNGYNLLGIFNDDFNKRNYGGEGYTDFRSHAAAVGVYAVYRTK
jgi:hypothetical protein